jgi:hypothetical protein
MQGPTEPASQRGGGGPYHLGPAGERLAGYLDGLRIAKSQLLERARAAIAASGWTLDDGLEVHRLEEGPSRTFPAPAPDNPHRDPHYAEGFADGYAQGLSLFLPPLRVALSKLQFHVDDDGDVSPRIPPVSKESVMRASHQPPLDDAAIHAFLDSAAPPASESRISRRVALVGACVAILGTLGVFLLGSRPREFPETPSSRPQVWLSASARTWSGFPASFAQTMAAVDQWVVTHRNAGQEALVIGAVQAVMAQSGNHQDKGIVASYVAMAERHELVRFLLPGLDVAITEVPERRTIAAAVRKCVQDTGAVHFTSGDRAMMQAYLGLALEPDPEITAWLQEAVATLVGLGL